MAMSSATLWLPSRMSSCKTLAMRAVASASLRRTPRASRFWASDPATWSVWSLSSSRGRRSNPIARVR